MSSEYEMDLDDNPGPSGGATQPKRMRTERRRPDGETRDKCYEALVKSYLLCVYRVNRTKIVLSLRDLLAHIPTTCDIASAVTTADTCPRQTISRTKTAFANAYHSNNAAISVPGNIERAPLPIDFVRNALRTCLQAEGFK